MRRKTLYSAVAVVAGVWFAWDVALRAQPGGGPGGTGPGNASVGNSDGIDGTPNVPGSGPASPIDRSSPSHPSPVEAGRAGGAGSSSPSRIDALSADRVRSAIAADPALSAFNQDVRVLEAKGRIRLTGRVGTSQERDLLGERAAQIVGASRVDNQIAVSDQGR